MKYKLFVLLGGDGVGKSTTLSLINKAGWKIVSYSQEHVPSNYTAVNSIAKTVRDEAIPEFTTFSSEFRSAYYHLFVAYLQDVVEKALSVSNVLCDSYYYKFLAKEQVNKGDARVLSIWRTLRKPDKVIFLNLAPEVAYSRVIKIRKLQKNELALNSDSCRSNFVNLQTKLTRHILAECTGIPIDFVSTMQPAKKVAEQVMSKLVP